jgi:anaerobic ribonucleoside-triphosphate reductase activating protein
VPVLTLNVAGVVEESIVDGPGIRCAIFAQGCSFDCPGCQNPQTHAFGVGENRSVEELLEIVVRNPLVRGVTFSGGDPFFQAEGFAELSARLKTLGYETAAYTGFRWEDLMSHGSPAQKAFLSHLDILIDGPFVLAQRDLDLRFRGCSAKRIIDVPKSLALLATSPDLSLVLCAAERWTGPDRN